MDAPESEIAEQLREYGYRILEDEGIGNTYLSVNFSEHRPSVVGSMEYNPSRKILKVIRKSEDNYNDLKQWRREVEALKNDGRYMEVREDLHKEAEKLDEIFELYDPFFRLCEDGRYRAFERVESHMPGRVEVRMNPDNNKTEDRTIKTFTHEIFHYVIRKKMPIYSGVMKVLNLPGKVLENRHSRMVDAVSIASTALTGLTTGMWISGKMPLTVPVSLVLSIALLNIPRYFDEILTDYLAERYLEEKGYALGSFSEDV